MSFNWKLNGVPAPLSFVTVSGGGVSETVFTPPCSMAGPNIVSVEVDDGYESTPATWSVTIVNPLVAQIIGFTPIVSPVVIQENDTQVFTVSASGQAPFSYSWAINSDPGVSSNEIPSYEAAASSFPQPDGITELGDNTFTVTVTDDNGSTDNHIFNIKINSPPSLSSITPSETDTKMNVNSTRVFSVVANDLNNDPLTYTWTLNGGAAPAGVFSGSGSSITFNPTESQLGDNVIKLVVSDGLSLVETSNTWNINVNHFSEECNALAAGEVCTLVGPPGLGSDIDPVAQPQVAKIRPYDIINDGNDNFFIADAAQDVVWFYNRSASPITVIGTTVNAGKLKVIAGVGANGNGSPGVTATRYRLHNPYGVAWDSDRGDLYVSVYSNHRVVRFNNSGISQHVICSGQTNNDAARNTEGAPATNHSCREPVGIGIYHNGATRRLYVASYNNHNIKYFDISDSDTNNWTGHLLICDKNSSGTCQAIANRNGTLGDDSVAATRNPWALHVDSNGLVFWTELNGCRIGVANPTGVTYNFFGGSVTLSPNTAYRVGGSGNCNTFAANNDSHKVWNQQRIRSPRGVLPYYSGSTYYGWFVSNNDHDAITFFNTSGATMNIGGRTIDNNKSHIIWGNRVDGFNGDSSSAISTLLWRPWGLTMNSANNSLILADTDNYRVRSLDISVNDGQVSTLITGKEKADFSGGSNTPATSVLMAIPHGLFYDSQNSTMMFTDRNNHRVRGINTNNGLENVFVGQGWGNADVEEEDPSDVGMRYPRDILVHNNGIIYSDANGCNGGNRNSQVRVFNRNPVATNFFGTVVPAGKVSTIVGNFVLGAQCPNNWSDNYGGGQSALETPLGEPHGLATDGTNLYIADRRNHCILKVDSTGYLSVLSGNCRGNGSGDINGTYNDPSIKYRYPEQLIADPLIPGGLMVADQTDRNTSKVKYINTTNDPVTIADQIVPANTVSTIFESERGSGVAAFENWICYTSGYRDNSHLGNHNIVCKDRTDNLGIIQFRIGPSGSSDKGAVQFNREDEGVTAPAAKFFAPCRIAFDSEGNLYISEYSGHTVRFVKKWW